jgi:hypothetical protein
MALACEHQPLKVADMSTMSGSTSSCVASDVTFGPYGKPVPANVVPAVHIVV